MAFDWTSLIDLAELLQQQAAAAPNPEAHFRSAVNRAYFGAFGHANSYAVQFLNYQPRDNSDEHGRLREHLRRKKRRAASEDLGKLREWRNNADYLDTLPWPDMSATVANAIRQARQVVAALPPPQPRQG